MKKNFLFFLVLGLFLCFSCEELAIGPNGFTKYIIKKPSNTPDGLTLFDLTYAYYSDTFVVYIRPDTSLFCSYPTSFVSKYFGWREDTEKNGKNSIRLGFRTTLDTIEFVGYAHNNHTEVVSETIIKYSYRDILNLIPTKEYQVNGIKVTIIFTPNTYEISMAGHTVVMKRTSGFGPHCSKYREYPYLGGDNIEAQKDLLFYLKW